MDVAQIYMLALRPTMVPIAGESWAAMPFYGQVELEGWSWDLSNAEEKVEAEMAREKYQKTHSEYESDKSDAIKSRFRGDRAKVEIKANMREMEHLRNEQARMKQALVARQQRGEEIDLVKDFKDFDAAGTRLTELEESIAEQGRLAATAVDKIKSEAEKALEKAKEEDERKVDKKERIADLEAQNYEFTFRKRVDISTTQLLNCLKAGDKLPTVTLTMHQSSSNTPWILVFTLTGVRLKEYKLRVETSDTMTDMKEDWTAEFEQFGYVYQNRPHAGGKAATAGHVNTAAARMATQQTVRTFMMVPRRLGL
jgi:type VI protein secretion system component Hcp